jgi:hypothetical protein
MDDEQEKMNEFALGQKCTKCGFSGFDPTGRAFYTCPGLYEFGCQNCGRLIRVRYDKITWPLDPVPAKITIY